MIEPADRFQFGRVVQEYARWLAVDDDDRSPAPAWWWGPALAVRSAREAMPDGLPQLLRLAPGASYADAAAMLLDAIAEQTSLPWPDEFPHRFKPAAEDNPP